MNRMASKAVVRLHLTVGIAILLAIVTVAVVRGQEPTPETAPPPSTPTTLNEESSGGGSVVQNEGEETSAPMGDLIVVPGLIAVGDTTLAVGLHVDPYDLEVAIQYSEHFTLDGEACGGSPGATPSATAPTWVTLEACTAGNAYVRLVDSATRSVIMEVSVTVAPAGSIPRQAAEIDITISDVESTELVPGGSGDDFSVDITGLNIGEEYELSTYALNHPRALAFNQDCSNYRQVNFISGVSSITKDYTVYGCLAPGSLLWSVLYLDGIPIDASEIDPMVNVQDPTVSFEKDSYSVMESYNRSILVKLSHGRVSSISIPIVVSNDTAQSADYTVRELSGGILTFNAEDDTESFLISAAMDNVIDDNETIDLSFGTLPFGVSEGLYTAAKLTILEPGSPPPLPPTPTPTPLPLPPPPAPTGLDANGHISNGKVMIWWDPAIGASSYDLRFRLEGYSNYGNPTTCTYGDWIERVTIPTTISNVNGVTTVVANPSVATNGDNTQQLTALSAYRLQVRAKNLGGKSQWSDFTFIYPTDDPPMATNPTDFVILPPPSELPRIASAPLYGYQPLRNGIHTFSYFICNGSIPEDVNLDGAKIDDAIEAWEEVVKRTESTT